MTVWEGRRRKLTRNEIYFLPIQPINKILDFQQRNPQSPRRRRSVNVPSVVLSSKQLSICLFFQKKNKTKNFVFMIWIIYSSACIEKYVAFSELVDFARQEFTFTDHSQ